MDWNGVGRANWGGQDRVRNIQDQKGPVLVHVGLPGGAKAGNSEGKSIGMVHEVPPTRREATRLDQGGSRLPS